MDGIKQMREALEITQKQLADKMGVHYSAVPFEAYVIDGKKAVKLVAYRRGFGGGWYSLGGWQQLSRAVDTM